MASSEAPTSHISENARRVLKDMSRWNIPPSPQNYHVWFEHVSGVNAALSREIDAVLDSGVPITSETTEALFLEYIQKEKDAAALREAQDKIHAVLRKVIQEVLSAGEVASGYRASLEQYALELAKAESLGDVERIIVDLLMSTTDMKQSTVSLQERLDETTEQAEALQDRVNELRGEATKDALTELQNRKAAGEKIRELIERFAYTGEAFSVIMFDIDHFKRFNDTHGHQIGDAVLRKVGTVLRHNLKGRDLPARYGGEEFMVVLPKTPLDAGKAVAENLCQAIATKRLKIAESGEDIGSVTASFGVAEYRETDTLDALVARADQALYLAKNSGRDTVRTERDL